MIHGIDKNLSFLVVLMLAGCTYFNKNDEIVAKVGEKVLTLPQVQEIIPSGMSEEDSLLMAEDFIKKWVRNELLIDKAEENLEPVMKDVTRELLNYRNSLIIYRYKNELMRQKMDTVVSQEEIEQYYKDNKNNFKLNRNIIKGVYIKIIKGVFDNNIIRTYCENTTPPGLTELTDFCVQYAKSYGIYIESWIEFDVILNNIPMQTDSQEDYLSRNESIEFTDFDYYYYAFIKDYRLLNEIAPLDYVYQNIKSLILNKRKIEFLKKIEDDIYSDGVRNRKFIIYTN